ncbi:MAG: hypothetical protein ABH983_04035, partial [Candidatus Micrarchaeota archaeon]
ECDYPDLVPVMEYGSITSEDLEDNRTKLRFTLETAIWNYGAEKIPAGTELTAKWSQESVEIGGSSEQEVSVIKVTTITDKKGNAKAVYNILNKSGSNIASMSTMPYNPLERSSISFTLPTDLEPGSYVTVNNQHFTATVEDGECILITHTVDVIDELDEELDENNLKTIEGYDTLSGCYGVMEVDIESALGNADQIPIGSGKDLQADIAKVGMDHIINIIKDVGPDGMLINVGPVILDIPEDASTELVEVQIKQKAKTGTLSVIKTFSPVYEIQSEKGFSKSVKLTFAYDENLLGGVPEQSLAIFENRGSGWNMVQSTVNTEANTVSAQLSHFSLYTVSNKKQIDSKKFEKDGELIYSIKKTEHAGREAYRIMKSKRVKLLGLFDVDMEFESVVDAEGDEVMEETKPWWSFLTVE